MTLLAAASIGQAQPHGGGGGMGGGKPSVPVAATVAEVTRQDFADEIEALGTTRANETVTLAAKVTETVREILFDDGQSVKAGDILVILDSAAETADLKAAEAAAREKRSAYRRAKGLEQQKIVSKAAFEEKEAQLQQSEADIQSIRSRLDDTVIRAPFDGVLGFRDISVGTLLKPGDRITTIDDLSQMKVDFDVPAVFLQHLKSGLAVSGVIEGFPDRTFSGTVATVDTQVDPVTRSVRARAIVPNPDMLLRPGLLMTVRLQLDPRSALTVPEAAMIQQKDKAFVYTLEEAEGKTVARKKEIAWGGRTPGFVEVLAGLEEGQKVVVAGSMHLSDGQEVKAVSPAKAQ